MEPTAGLCECGCGKPTPIAQRNRYDRGQIKGQPLRFVPGHNSTRASVEERFWRYVHKTDGYCWLWRGSRDARGYGRLQGGGRGKGHVKAHRLSYELHYGPFDESLFVCHRCDNPQCVNPDHLFLGTHRDNMDDATEKKRMGRPFAVETEAVAAFLRAGGTYRSAAEHFGVPPSTIWRHAKRAGLVRSE